jgi:ribonuclease HI/pterin-4a-carbinolamine dehydratase
MWKKDKDQLYKKFEFKDFLEAMDFVNQVARAAEAANHHPAIAINWNTVELRLSTHDKGDKVTIKDKKLAQEIDELTGVKVPKSAKIPDEIKIFGDGGSRGNPGPAACGYVICSLDDKILETGGEYMDITTNNQAEYHALEMALESALKHGVKKVHVFMDSQLVIRQIEGRYKVKSEELRPRYENVMNLSKKFAEFSYQHVPRELNKLADAEVNRILDSV